jgi:hypothetical protein
LDCAQETDSFFISSSFVASNKRKEKIKTSFSVFYKIDEQEVEHALSLNNYHKAQRMLITSIGF